MLKYFNSAASQGMEDGLLNYPDESHVTKYKPNNDLEILLPSYEIERLAIAEIKISNVKLKWEETRQKLESKLIILDRDLKIYYNEFKVAKDEFFKSGMKRTKKLINGYVYILMMLILGSFEFPLNYDVAKSQIGETFNLFGGEVNEALFVAFGMISVLLISAHVVGSKLKQWHSGWNIKKYIVGIIALMAVFMVLHSMYYLRLTNEIEIQQGGLNDTAFSVEVNDVEDKPLSKNEKMDIEAKITNLMLLNAGFLIIGISLSYFSHDEDQELEFKEQERIKVYKKLKATLEKREKIASLYDTKLHIAKEKAKSIQFETISIITEYRDWNQKYRTDKSILYPKSEISLALFSDSDFGEEKDIHKEDINNYMHILDELSLSYIKKESK